MDYVRIDMKAEDFDPKKFALYSQKEEFVQLKNDWQEVVKMNLNRQDIVSFDHTDRNEGRSSLLLNMYTSKYKILFNKYPTITNYLKFVIHETRQHVQPNATNEGIGADATYEDLINFNGEVTEFRKNNNYAPADFAVLFYQNPPLFKKLKFGREDERKSYLGVKLLFSRRIVCEVIEDERAGNMYKHLKLPKSLDNCIVSILPKKKVIQKIWDWPIPTPYNLGDSSYRNTDIGPRQAETPDVIRLCCIKYLDIISYDTDDLDIRTFAECKLVQ